MVLLCLLTFHYLAYTKNVIKYIELTIYAVKIFLLSNTSISA